MNLLTFPVNEFATLLGGLGKVYNRARVAPESNDIGLAVASKLANAIASSALIVIDPVPEFICVPLTIVNEPPAPLSSPFASAVIEILPVINF